MCKSATRGKRQTGNIIASLLGLGGLAETHPDSLRICSLKCEDELLRY